MVWAFTVIESNKAARNKLLRAAFSYTPLIFFGKQRTTINGIRLKKNPSAYHAPTLSDFIYAMFAQSAPQTVDTTMPKKQSHTTNATLIHSLPYKL